MISSKEYKAGLFVLLTLLLLGFMIVKVGQGGFFWNATYDLFLTVDNATGLAHKTPVQLAGVPIGVVTDIRLNDQNKARLTLSLQNKVKVDADAKAQIRTTGILGDAYIEIIQPPLLTQTAQSGQELSMVATQTDFSSLTDVMGQIAQDIKAITSQLKKNMAGDGSSFDNTLKNLETITRYLAKNENNVNITLDNMKAITENLNAILATNRSSLQTSTSNIAEITSSINQGEGTIGKLIKSDETVDKINESLDSINNLVGGVNRFEIQMGGHTEYLGGTEDFKNYVSLALKPRPDKYFLFEVVSDPDPSFSRSIEETTVTTGGASVTTTTQKSTKQFNDLLFSLQFAKRFNQITVRGGLIESSGGMGLDYHLGPASLEFSAFDFKTDSDDRPHLKLMGSTKLTKTFYLLGGFDDFINTHQDLDWFMGAGFKFTDEDVKSLFGLVGLSSAR